MTLKVGDKVYMVHSGGWRAPSYVPGVVTKITPSGLVDVCGIRLDGTVSSDAVRYRNGRKLGLGSRLDTEMSFKERSAWVKDDNRRKQAALQEKP